MIAVAHASPHPAAHRAIHAGRHVHASVSHAPAASGASPGFTLVPIAIVVVAVLITSTVLNGKKKLAATAALAADLTRLQTQALRPVAHPSFITEPGETCYWAQGATQWSIHNRTQRVGGYGGSSIRIARGVYVHGGSFASTPITTQVAAQDDSGVVYVTDRRIVFIGQRATREIAISKIVGTEPFQDGLQVDVANKKALTLKTGDSRFAYVALRVIHGFVGASTDVVPPGPDRPPTFGPPS
jgi:hypothetical protein